MASLKLVTAPTIDPVTVAEVKTYLRIDGTDDDTMLGNFITAATKTIESFLNRKCINQTWDFWLDCFPYEVKFDSLIPDGVTEGKLSEYISTKKFIEIPIFPLVSVTHLKTYDDDGTAYTMSSSDYIVDANSEPPRLSLKNSTTWPSTYLRPVNGIVIQFVVGYGATAASTPYPIKQAIMEMCGKFYNSRGCEDSTINKATMAILAPYRVMRI